MSFYSILSGANSVTERKRSEKEIITTLLEEIDDPSWSVDYVKVILLKESAYPIIVRFFFLFQ